MGPEIETEPYDQLSPVNLFTLAYVTLVDQNALTPVNASGNTCNNCVSWNDVDKTVVIHSLDIGSVGQYVINITFKLFALLLRSNSDSTWHDPNFFSSWESIAERSYQI